VPRCYLYTIAERSALDSSSNNFTLFSLVEQVQVNQFPVTLPFEIHSYWKFAPDEINVDFQLRIILVSSTGDEVSSDPAPLRSSTPRFRVRATGIHLRRPGSYELRIEWRESESEHWTRDNVFWPLQVSSSSERAPDQTELPDQVAPQC
jgi:hypothetical protein